MRSLAIAVSLMLRWLQWLSMKKRSPLKCNVLIHFSHHPLISFGGKNDSFCAHAERGCVPAPRSRAQRQAGGHVDLVVSLWLRLTMGQIWFRAVLRSRSVSFVRLPLLPSRQGGFQSDLKPPDPHNFLILIRRQCYRLEWQGKQEVVHI